MEEGDAEVGGAEEDVVFEGDATLVALVVVVGWLVLVGGGPPGVDHSPLEYTGSDAPETGSQAIPGSGVLFAHIAVVVSVVVVVPVLWQPTTREQLVVKQLDAVDVSP